MAEREQIKKKSNKKGEEDVEDVAPATSETGEKLKAEMDDLLDEIDEVLDTNAEEFVKSYVQKAASNKNDPRGRHHAEALTNY